MTKIFTILFILLSFSSYSTVDDYTSFYSNNIVKVTVDKQTDKILIEYCTNKALVSTCSHLGRGWYSMRELKKFKNKKYLRSGVAIVGGTAATVGGVFLTGVGLIVAPAFAPGLVVTAGGVGTIIYNVGKVWKINNYLNDKFLSDKDIISNSPAVWIDGTRYYCSESKDIQNDFLFKKVLSECQKKAYADVEDFAFVLNNLLETI